MKLHLFCITARISAGKSVPQLSVKGPSWRFIAIQDLLGLFVSFHLHCNQRHSHANSILCTCAYLFGCVCVFGGGRCLGPGRCLCALCVCELAVKVFEPDGGCGQKWRIAKVHVPVTLCFLHDKDCLSFPLFSPHIFTLFLSLSSLSTPLSLFSFLYPCPRSFLSHHCR